MPFFLARPARTPTAGVVVIHEGFGLNQQVLRLCEGLALEGFAVAAPDLFFRTGGPGARPHEEHRAVVGPDQLLADLAVTATALRRTGARRVGVIGFCWGGASTWHAALHGEGFDAAVGFYGVGIAADLAQPRCPTLLFLGGSDPHIPSDDIAKVVAHHADTVVYPEAGHAFMRDGSDLYVPEAAADAWEKMLDHLRRHLHGVPSK